jgi:hypothetical protein
MGIFDVEPSCQAKNICFMLNPSPLYKCDLEMKFFKFFLFVARLALVAFNKGKSPPISGK